VEGVTSGADLHYFDLGGVHLGHRVLAEGVADVPTPVERRHGK